MVTCQPFPLNLSRCAHRRRSHMARCLPGGDVDCVELEPLNESRGASPWLLVRQAIFCAGLVSTLILPRTPSRFSEL